MSKVKIADSHSESEWPLDRMGELHSEIAELKEENELLKLRAEHAEDNVVHLKKSVVNLTNQIRDLEERLTIQLAEKQKLKDELERIAEGKGE